MNKKLLVLLIMLIVPCINAMESGAAKSAATALQQLKIKEDASTDELMAWDRRQAILSQFRDMKAYHLHYPIFRKMLYGASLYTFIHRQKITNEMRTKSNTQANPPELQLLQEGRAQIADLIENLTCSSFSQTVETINALLRASYKEIDIQDLLARKITALEHDKSVEKQADLNITQKLINCVDYFDELSEPVIDLKEIELVHYTVERVMLGRLKRVGPATIEGK